MTRPFATLRYAGNKASTRTVAGRFGVSQSCLHAVLIRVMDYLCGIAHTCIQFPGDLNALAADFELVYCVCLLLPVLF